MTFQCSHCKCDMPRSHGDHEIAVGWTVVRVEQHNVKNVSIGYLYLCPDDMLDTKSRQVGLALSAPSPPPEKT